MDHVLLTGTLAAAPPSLIAEYALRTGKVYDDSPSYGAPRVIPCLSAILPRAIANAFVRDVNAIDDTLGDDSFLHAEFIPVPDAETDQLIASLATLPRVGRNCTVTGTLGYWPIAWQWAETTLGCISRLRWEEARHINHSLTETQFIRTAFTLWSRRSPTEGDERGFARWLALHTDQYRELARRYARPN